MQAGSARPAPGRWDAEPTWWWIGLGLVVVLALSLRVGMLSVSHPAEVSDAGDYRALAQGLLDRGEYGAVGGGGWDGGLMFRAYRPPGYPFVRAALLWAFGPAPTAALALNVIAELIALAFVLAIARRILGRVGALCAGLLFATYVLFTASLMTESLTMALWSALAFATLTKPHLRSMGAAIGVGVLVGVAILVRPVSLFWIPVIVLGWKRERIAWLAAALVPVVLIVGAWTVRNTLVFGSVVWISTNLGVHNAPDFGIPWSRLTELRQTGLSEAAADRALTREILAVAIAHPGDTATLFFRRVVDLFSVSPDNCWELGFARSDVYRSSVVAVGVLDFAVALWRMVYVVAGVGMLRMLFVRRLGGRGLLAIFGLFVVLQCVLSRGDVRLMAPAIPILCVFAARALVSSSR